jgi:gamma-glutamyltranspeptidase/glutathione hydrolase
MAATSHTAATTAALNVMDKGGNAVDAALAACAVLAVVEPQMTGIGGDCFAIIAQPDGTIHGVNGSGRAPAMLSADTLRVRWTHEIPFTSVHAITVPGALRGFEYMASHFGTRRVRTLLEPAITLARDGWIVSDRVAYDFAKPEFAGQVEADPVLSPACFARKAGFRWPATGMVWPQLAKHAGDHCSAMGWTRSTPARSRATSSAHVRDKGGADEPVGHGRPAGPMRSTPITADYRGLTIAELPPNGQGVVALIALKVLERFDLAAMDARQSWSVCIWSLKPAARPTPCAMLLSATSTPASMPHKLYDEAADRRAGGADRSGKAQHQLRPARHPRLRHDLPGHRR